VSGGREKGTFKKRVKVSNIQKPELSFEEDFWVDTGAFYSFIPEDYLERFQVEASATRGLISADGRRETRLFGACDFQIEGLDGRIPCPVVLAPKGPLLLLGVTALEKYGVEADPVHKTLTPILAVIGGFLSSSPVWPNASDG
jgi:predicted aspartyl protease